ncbi:MAG: hypothetical protein Q8J78_14280 [Moraxellaceae bacterium]|nr:hypothetical protein [Moraxellaceae bacterium]
MKRYLVPVLAGVLASVLLVGVALVLWWLRADEQVVPVAGHAPADITSAPLIDQSGLPVLAPELPDSRDDVALPEPETPVADPVESLRLARLQGDARAPAVVRSPEPEPPTPEELADPQAYQRYEARQNARLYRDYVKAADAEVPKLRQQISEAQAKGLSPEQLREGEEKLRRIEAMRQQLEADNPGLMAP